METVFELSGDQSWQAEELKGRLGVPEERLASGDCSLIIRDVQIGDAGRYESFMVVDGVRSSKTRVFIQSVRLLVYGQSGVPPSSTHLSGFPLSPFSGLSNLKFYKLFRSLVILLSVSVKRFSFNLKH